MVKYVLTAMVLKSFSISPVTRAAYRALGNSVGAKKRAKGKMPDYYLKRVNRTLHLNRTYGLFKDGDLILEIGTGWLHWEAITTRLFFDIRAFLYDVWDNRQINRLKNYLSQLDNGLHEIDASNAQRERAHDLIRKIMASETFDEIYELLGFEYRVDPKGKLEKLGKENFDAIISAGVLEHVKRSDVPALVKNISSLLKTGGYSVQSINIEDHLYSYDRSVSRKQYMIYSDRTWNTWFDNDVQYINRMQKSEWLALFSEAGLKLIEMEVGSVPQTDIKVGKRFENYDITDLCCINLKILHRKDKFSAVVKN